MQSIYETIQVAVEAAIPNDGLSIRLERPRNSRHGDIGLPCFEMAQALDISAPEAARQIVNAIGSIPGVREVRAVGPFVNFFLDRVAYVADLARQAAGRDSFGKANVGAGQRVLIEHTSINPNASPHIGRSRNALIGDFLVRLYRHLGYDVEAHYYVNDLGKQIALLVLAVPEPDRLTSDAVLDLYVQAHERAERDPAFEQAAFDLLERFEQGDAEARAAFRRVVDVCLQGQLAVLRRLGITYDCFDYESNFLDAEEAEEVIAALERQGVLFTDAEERLVADLQKLGYEREEGRYFVLKRANGTTMYGCRDLAYTKWKADRAAGGLHLIVLGEDHQLYFEQLSLLLRAAGVEPPEVQHYAFVLLSDGKMSTRQGNVVLLSDFLDEAVARARERVEANATELSADESAAVAEAVGVGAVKFTLLKVSPSSNVIFDWGSALSFEGDSGPYLQYTHARICSLLRKAEGVVPRVAEEVCISNTEWELAQQLGNLAATLDAARERANPALVANYALDVARSFNAFYHKHPVLNAERPEEQASRLSLVRISGQVLRACLELLRIEALEQM